MLGGNCDLSNTDKLQMTNFVGIISCVSVVVECSVASTIENFQKIVKSLKYFCTEVTYSK